MRYNSASDWLKGTMLGSKTNTAHSRENHRIPGLFSTMNSRVLLISSLEKLSARTIFQILDIHSCHTD